MKTTIHTEKARERYWERNTAIERKIKIRGREKSLCHHMPIWVTGLLKSSSSGPRPPIFTGLQSLQISTLLTFQHNFFLGLIWSKTKENVQQLFQTSIKHQMPKNLLRTTETPSVVRHLYRLRSHEWLTRLYSQAYKYKFFSKVFTSEVKLNLLMLVC